MSSHMAVQTFATARNSQVEFLVHYILERFCNELTAQKKISNASVSSQKHFTSEIASDIWDHFITAKNSASNKELKIWCQTTYYKGNKTSSAEPNKTYEVRETLVEAISVREFAEVNPKSDVRTIHFTVGDKKYTYQWFLDLKAAVFDQSLYIGAPGIDVFSAVEKALKSAFTEKDKTSALDKEVADRTALGKLIIKTLEELHKWFSVEKMPSSYLADAQWQLVKNELLRKQKSWPDFSKVHGVDIKGRVNKLLFEKESAEKVEPLILKTLSKVLDKKPFLSEAIKVTTNWDAFEKEIEKISQQSSDVEDLLSRLWTIPAPLQLITRRILLRIHTEEPIAYIQDRNIKGLTEHNLYGGEHSEAQVKSMCMSISSDLKKSGLKTKKELSDLISKRGRKIINQARWFEAKNGTEIKPSFEYAELALVEKGYQVLSPKRAKFDAVGYHAQIAQETVKPYVNLKVIADKNGEMLGVLKAKYFRIQEFARRCKEEAFVGLTLKYALQGKKFVPRLKVPLIMFVDMAEDCIPPDYAVKRLSSFGWEVVFSTDALIKLVSQSEKDKS